MLRVTISSLSRRGLVAATGAAVLAFGVGAGLAQEKVVKIGTPLALTGGLADEGHKQAAAYELWLERINAAGGINIGGEMHKVELVSYDYQTDGNRAQQLAETLITKDGVNFMTAPFGSGHSKIVAGVAERYGVPIIAVASSEPVHDQGFKNLFGTLAPSLGLIDSMLSYFKESKPDLKTVAIVGRDDVFPKIMADSMSKRAPEAGVEVVHSSLYPVGTLDHSAAITDIKSSNPDWIYVTGYTQDLVLFRQQMEDLGVKAPIVTMITGPAYREFMDNLGDLANGVSSATWWHYSVDYKGDDVFGTPQAFYDAVVAKTGQEPDYVHASSAAALIALQKALEAAGTTDRDAVRKALEDLDIVTFYGPINFREDGMNSARDLPIIQVQDGEPVVVYPPDIRKADLQLMGE
jgi:branched-chain amino acid transport system substrate-binding protein